jgi:hypothetical protein
MENEHAQAVASASSGLNRAAMGLGAEVIGLVGAAGSEVKVTCCWSRSPYHAPERRLLESSRLLTDLPDESAVRTAVAGSPLAAALSNLISEQARSFLLFPWQNAPKFVTGVIGFAEPRPPVSQVPDAVVENLNLLGWAEWSANEIARLRDQLRIVNERLAGRKLVERAKSALQSEQGIAEEQAYEYLRRMSRKRRITLVEMSAEILGGRVGLDRVELLATGHSSHTV